MIDYANVPIIVWDTHLIITRFNHAFEKLLGISAEKILGKSIEILFPQSNLIETMETIKDISSHRNMFMEEIDVCKDDKTILKVIWNSAIIYDEDQVTPISVIAQGYDVTTLKAAEMEVSYFQELLQYIINHSNSAVAVHDLNMNYIYVSQKYLDQYNVNDPNIIGKHHYDIFPDLPQKWRDVHQRCLKGEVINADRDIYPRDDGTVQWTRWECRPWFKQDQSIGGIIVYTEVITDLIQTELELESSRQNLLDVMNSLPIGIAVNSVDPVVKFNYMNENFWKIYGTTREILEKNDSFWEAVYEDPIFREELKKRVEADIASNDPTRMQWLDVPIAKKDEKTRYISAYATPIPKSNLLISTVIDVTDQKLKEDEIRYISYHDFITGIPNRRYFSEMFESYDHEGNYPIVVMIMDLNGLKLINDAFGHGKGNQALRQIAQILKSLKREKDIISRIGGDEFAIILPQTKPEEANGIRSKIEQDIENQTIEGIHYSLSIGMAVKSNESQSINDVLKIAEEDMYKNKVFQGRSMRSRAINGILSTLTDKFEVEKLHSEKVSWYCVEIGNAMQLNKADIDELKMAGMLHDIGKISIPDHILSKPGKLSREEWSIMQEHTIHGYNILRAADEYSNLALYALTHHERIDGTGYPNGLKGDEIPLISRIIGVVDAYEAMTADRPYRKSLNKEYAISELIAHSNTQFDAQIVDIFVNQVLKNER